MKRKTDFYTHKAKTQGYPARSVYKLQEILLKYKLLKKGDRVLDLGAAPGSFSQYLLERLKGTGWVCGVDISPEISVPKRFPNFSFLQGDIFSASVLTWIMSKQRFDLVVSDAAPATTGNRFVDTQKSLEIAERVLVIAQTVLKEHGMLIVKLFQGGEEQLLMREMKTCFKRVKGFKPKASRRESFETYYIGFDFLNKS
ncbi:MAG: RlmE family RNA methyltransferase [Spirochaetales bacterium]|nr:RlmE family RNA methyltransferase [Spirochaetales bacterium]